MTPLCRGDASPYPSPPNDSERDVRTRPDARPLLLTVKEAAAMIGIGRSTLYRLMDAGEIDSVHIHTSRRIPLESVYVYVDKLTGPTTNRLSRKDQV
jgi:excisionase family DNA binding protein